jgi:predicted ATPase
VTEIALEPLDEADTASLAAHVSGIELGAGASAHLYAETEGNPLFIIETLRAGERAGALVQGPALSPKIQSVIEARLAQLSNPARGVANLAAALGRSFAFDVLAVASEEDEDWLVQGLDELWQQRIIREQSDQDYDFSHNKIREVVYNSLSAANRRLLHRRIAAAMETIYAANLDAVSKQLALQYEAAGSSEKAVAYYLRAGQLAQQIYANAEAIQLYDRALVILGTLP